jgi:hypothetical protein
VERGAHDLAEEVEVEKGRAVDPQEAVAVRGEIDTALARRSGRRDAFAAERRRQAHRGLVLVQLPRPDLEDEDVLLAAAAQAREVGLSDDVLGDAVPYLIPNIKLAIEFYEGRPVGIELPLTVEMKVMETEPAIKGASVSNVGKPAKMETGLIVSVPPFINEGDVIRIDTATGSYIERVAR